MATAQWKLLISGRVQGVSYRAWTAQQARVARIRGYVRNLDDGRVEAVIEGEPDMLRALVDVCYEGPPAARVEYIEVDEDSCEGPFNTFDIMS
ncbi:MAG: acylphosphatase [Pseudohongiellaceae bacterium]